MDPSLFDTDMLSEAIKGRNPVITAKAAQYLRSHGLFAFSAFTRFEIKRGYKEKKATRLLTDFATFCGRSLVLPITDEIIDRAADLWALARQNGHPHGDADLLIAATSLEHDLTLITGNVAHFAWIPGLKIDNWRS